MQSLAIRGFRNTGLLAAPFPNALFPDAFFPKEAVPDAFSLDLRDAVLPYHPSWARVISVLTDMRYSSSRMLRHLTAY
jgi:hypothetical protein